MIDALVIGVVLTYLAWRLSVKRLVWDTNRSVGRGTPRDRGMRTR